MREYFDKRAKERMSAGGKAAGNGREKGKETLPTPIQARDEAGAAVGVSGQSIDRAERLLGESLAKVVKHGGDKKSKSRDVTSILSDLSINKMQSHRWQLMASVPQDTFEAGREGKAEGWSTIRRTWTQEKL